MANESRGRIELRLEVKGVRLKTVWEWLSCRMGVDSYSEVVARG